MRYIDTSMINRELIQRMIDHLNEYPEKYDQNKWGVEHNRAAINECSTPCCLAGLAVILADNGQKVLLDYGDVATAAEKLLNLDINKTRAYIFSPAWLPEWRKSQSEGFAQPTVEDAIFVLQAILDGTLADVHS